MKTWYQVIIYPKVFGFSISESGVIIDHPNWEWRGIKAESYKPYLISCGATVAKIAEQIYL